MELRAVAVGVPRSGRLQALDVQLGFSENLCVSKTADGDHDFGCMSIRILTHSLGGHRSVLTRETRQ